MTVAAAYICWGFSAWEVHLCGFLCLCKKQIPTTEELNTLNHYKANGLYPSLPCFRCSGKKKLEKTLLSESRGLIRTYTLSFCVRGKGKTRRNYVGMKNEQNDAGGNRTCIWDKGTGKH